MALIHTLRIKFHTIMSAEYWTERYQNCNTPWDMGSPSPPLTAYLQKCDNKNSKILVPGAGNAYEIEWLHENGFTNAYVMDISKIPLENLKQRIPDFPDSQILIGDFFDLNQKFDLVIEQTFFCALQPSQRTDYAKKMAEILNPGGKLAGVLFDFPLTKQGPPFGGSKEEYIDLFSPYFSFSKMETCYNSIKPRMGKELFFELIKP